MKYQFLSPDGFTIDNSGGYKTMKQAIAAFNKWRNRYELQGYYSYQMDRIPLQDLDRYCQLIRTK